MARKKKKFVKHILIPLVVILLVLAATGYAASKGVLGERALHLAQAVLKTGERPTPPPINLPGEEPGGPIDPSGPGLEPGPGSGEPSDSDPRPPGEEPGKKDDDPPAAESPAKNTPLIYAGQLLVIPGKGGAVENGVSQVVSKGTYVAGSKPVALTFDSGWLFDQTLALLDVLDRHGVTATFFPRALWAKDHPELMREIARRGHTVGNHSLTHGHMKEFSADEIRAEMRQSTEIIVNTAGLRPFMFRPPYGEYNQLLLDILAREGYPYTIMWTVDTHDWADEIGGKKVTVDYVVNRVLDNACPGAIVLMHVGGPKTVEALPRIIGGLKERGYTLTTVDKMLPSLPGGRLTHQVEAGETLYSISRKYGVTIEQIISANDL